MFPTQVGVLGKKEEENVPNCPLASPTSKEIVTTSLVSFEISLQSWLFWCRVPAALCQTTGVPCRSEAAPGRPIAPRQRNPSRTHADHSTPLLKVLPQGPAGPGHAPNVRASAPARLPVSISALHRCATQAPSTQYCPMSFFSSLTGKLPSTPYRPAPHTHTPAQTPLCPLQDEGS